MTLMVHTMIDAALGKIKRPHFTVWPGCTEKTLSAFLRGALAAEKFDFGDLPLELNSSSMGLPAFALPDLTPIEREFWRDGLVPLPAEICWYEFRLNGIRTALLIGEDKSDDPLWTVMRVDTDREGTFSFDGVSAGIRRRRNPSIGQAEIEIVGNQKAIQGADRTFGDDGIRTLFASSVVLSIYLTLMIGSKSTDVMTEEPPERLNRQRAKNGLRPLEIHRVVTIAPKRFRLPGAGGTHASPRLYWRRSHLRRLGSGKQIVIPRFLVGRADLGEVTHEYRVRL